jgi:hypothetical protein
MAQPVTVTVNGAIMANPSASTSLSPSLADTVQFGTQRVYSYKFANNFSINAPVSPVTIGLGGSMTKVRFMFIRPIGGPIEVLLTSPAGTDQALFVSEEWLWSSPSEGTQVTGIKMLGVSDVEMLLLGD